MRDPSRSPDKKTAGKSTTSAPLYVEFVGLPGAGKTTVFHEVIPRLTAMGYRCVCGRQGRPEVLGETRTRSMQPPPSLSIATRLRSHLTSHLQLWRLAITTYRYVVTVGELETKRFRMVRSMLQTVRAIKIGCGMVHADKGDLIIFSQGVAAYLRQIIVQNSTEKLGAVSLRFSEQIMPSRVAFVVFEIDPAAAADRVERRPRELGPWDRMDPEQRRLRMRSQLSFMEHVINFLVKAQVVHDVLRVDAMRAPADNAEVVADFIVRQLQTSLPMSVSFEGGFTS